MRPTPLWLPEQSPAFVPGFKVGHALCQGGRSGVSVILCPPGTVGGMDVGGSAAGTRQTDALQPGHLVNQVHALVLAGGSAFGLQAAGGVAAWLEERGVGLKTGDFIVPIVPTAVLYDLPPNQGLPRPDADLGRAACQAAHDGPTLRGNVGAGAGATIGKLFGQPQACKGGLGVAAMQLGELKMGALAVVNAFGDVLDSQGRIIVGARRAPGSHDFEDTAAWFLAGNQRRAFDSSGNTTLVAIATNAKLDKLGCGKVARLAQHGLTRVIEPAHSLFDGDLIVILAGGQVEADVVGLGLMAARLTAMAIHDAVAQATSLPGLPAARDLVPQDRSRS